MPKFREITGQFVGYVPDSSDTDVNPDRAPMNGRVTFTPEYLGGLIAFPNLNPPEFAHPEPIQARIVDGFVMVEVLVGSGDAATIVLQPLSLMVTLDAEAAQKWLWRADFQDVRVGTTDEYAGIQPWKFRIPDGTGPVDLTELVPITRQDGFEVTKGPRGYGITSITAASGVVTINWEGGDSVQVPIPAAALATATNDGLMPKADKAKLDNATSSPTPSRVMIRDANGRAQVADPNAAQDIANKAYADSAVAAISRSTGRRNVTSLAGSNVDVSNTGSIVLSRDGKLVTLTFDMVTFDSTAWVNLMSLPVGFRPAGNHYGFTSYGPNDAGITLSFAPVIVRSSGSVSFQKRAPSDKCRGTLTFLTSDTFPTTLPGTPA